jgi:hypothetical protein
VSKKERLHKIMEKKNKWIITISERQKYQSKRLSGECERKLAEHINVAHLCCQSCTFFFMNSPMYQLKRDSNN